MHIQLEQLGVFKVSFSCEKIARFNCKIVPDYIVL